jgi:hypothetical protein
MSLGVRLGAVVVAVLLVAGCAPGSDATKPTPSSANTSTATATPSSSPTPTLAPPEDADPSSFLLEGTPGVFDADGSWKGHYGFYTDASKTVRCDIWIFSGDSGGVTCGVMPGKQNLITYILPAVSCDGSTSNPLDGYSIGINFKVFDTGSAGFTGCQATANIDPSLVAATKVLLDNQTLHVDTDFYKYTCTVAEGVASCSEATSGASIEYGLPVVEFAG